MLRWLGNGGWVVRCLEVMVAVVGQVMDRGTYKGSSFKGAILANTVLSGSDFTGADLTGLPPTPTPALPFRSPPFSFALPRSL